jgi:predicted flap endonuclease-1-like 5' DNA nuclease
MNAGTGFVLGLITGWAIEWVIDWVYWRRRTADITRRLEAAESGAAQGGELKKSEGIDADLENQLSKLKADNAALQEKISALEAQNRTFQAPGAPSPVITSSVQQPAAEYQVNPAGKEIMASRLSSVPVTPDDLIVIKGIGPVISKKLNDAGIYTFRELAAITPEQLRGIVGDVIQRLANEDDIINQAKELAAQKDRAANS